MAHFPTRPPTRICDSSDPSGRTRRAEAWKISLEAMTAYVGSVEEAEATEASRKEEDVEAAAFLRRMPARSWMPFTPKWIYPRSANKDARRVAA